MIDFTAAEEIGEKTELYHLCHVGNLSGLVMYQVFDRGEDN